jgi:spore germination protein YaaH
VVLDSQSTLYAEFPMGPEYVVMCYNLYGTHSGPGPKADADFLDTTMEKNKRLPGQVTMAFANGGFQWDDDGQCTALTQVQALKKMEQITGEAVRDPKSNALSFTYEEDKRHYTVWFADGNTISYWISLAHDNGYRSFAIWRLGGNSDSEISELPHQTW